MTCSVMPTEHILYLPRSDIDEEHVLLNITSGGPSSLDLKLLATEGESPYLATLRKSGVSKLRDTRNQLTDYQWENVLRSTLLQRRIQGSDANPLEKVEVRASVAGDQLSVTFRNNISGITQKLGEIVFQRDESEELDIIRWAGTAAQRSDTLDKEVRDLTSKYDEQSRKFEKLSDQLENLIKAKVEHENALLQNFRGLLNSKKLKIRDQQRLLACAKIDPEQAAKLENARSISRSRAATTSRAGKRKATGDNRVSQSSEGSGFEGKASKHKPESDLSEQNSTPEHSDQELTEDESDDDPDSVHQAEMPPDRSHAADWVKKAIGEETRSDIWRPKGDLPPGGSGRAEQATQRVTEDKSLLIQEAGNEDEETDDDEL